jgi:predicted nucleotide-binding protein (sugar kinase/HSP70/actin superfamily)
LLKHNAIKKSNFNNLKNQDKVELMLIRAVILRAFGKTSNLAPSKLKNHYKKLKENPELLIQTRKELLETLNKTECLHAILSCRSWESISPFVLDFICDHPDMTTEQIITFVKNACQYKAGRGNDLDGLNGNKHRIDFLNKIWKDM